MLSGSLEDLPSLIRMTLVDPNALSTLDLSFNTFTEIPLVGYMIIFIQLRILFSGD
jgi:hypothetical protein